MDALRVVEKCTEEIIDHFRLPKTLCFPFIKKMLSWVYVAGWEEGKRYYQHRKPVMQFSMWGKLIGIFKSSSDAGRNLGIHRSGINRVTKGQQYSAKGFLWEKVDDSDEINKILDGWQNEL